MQKATAFDQLTTAIAGGAAAASGASPPWRCSPRRKGRCNAPSQVAAFPHRCLTASRPPVLADIATRRAVRGAPCPSPCPLTFSRARRTTTDRTGPRCCWPHEGRARQGIVAVREALARPDQVELLAQIGQAAMLAFDSLRLYTEEHNLALTLQRSFLPSRLPRRPGLEVAARYVPAADNAEIGGDFYELIELDDGRLLIAVGDVAGHSIHAATVMVELRHALRAYALKGTDRR